MIQQRLGRANKKMFFYLACRSTCTISGQEAEDRRRLGHANKKNVFLFGMPLDLHYLCGLKNNESSTWGAL